MHHQTPELTTVTGARAWAHNAVPTRRNPSGCDAHQSAQDAAQAAASIPVSELVVTAVSGKVRATRRAIVLIPAF
jgi:hypothetical protein